MQPRPTLLLPAALLAASLGCSSAHTQTYDINVTNATAGPVTISLAKDGPPYEAAWATPEDLAIESPRYRERGGMGVIPAGKTASVEKLTGKFEPNAQGYLRVYAGDLKLTYSLLGGRDLAMQLPALRPQWIIVEYPNTVNDATWSLLEGSGYKTQRTFPGWVDWTNGDVIVMKRTSASSQ